MAEPLIRRSVERSGDLFVEEIREKVERGHQQLWFVWSCCLEAAVVTQLAETPRGRVANIMALGGADLGNWIGLTREMEQWAREQGCVALEIIGRKGWARVHPDYRITGYVLSKRL